MGTQYKKGNITGIIAFVAVVIILLFLAPILLHIITTVTSNTASALRGVDPTNISSSAVTYIQDKTTGMFDWILAFFFLFNVILLLITSFLVDVHPAFFIVYLVACFFLIIFGPSVSDALNNIYGMDTFSGDVANLPIMNWILGNFGMVIVGIMALSAIIMFGKYKLTSHNNGGGIY